MPWDGRLSDMMGARVASDGHNYGKLLNGVDMLGGIGVLSARMGRSAGALG
jgi:hypothetical protein